MNDSNRGAYNQLAGSKPGQEVFTYSGGNYGKACATMAQKLGLNCTVLMPKSAPKDRVQLMQNLGAKPEVYDTMFQVCQKRDEYLAEGKTYFDPFDDLRLIKGYSSIGFEILESIPDVDIAIVPCGGGGLLSGISACLSQASSRQIKIYGVEPRTAATMHKSFLEGKPASVPDSHSVATGMCATRSGDFTTPICQRFVDEMLLLEDSEIIEAVRVLYDTGIRVEPTGAASLAALMFGKIPETMLKGKTVVAVLSGSNVTIEDLAQLVKT